MTTTAATKSLPFFSEMTDDALRASYIEYRTAAYNWSKMAQMTSPRSPQGRKVAAGWGRTMRAVEIIEGIARKRHISLAVGA